MSWSTWLGSVNLIFYSLPAQIFSANDSDREAKRSCASVSSKGAVYSNCVKEAKHQAKKPSPAPKPSSPLNRELATCSSLGKGPQIAQCKREAPKRVEAQSKAAPKPSANPALARELYRCHGLGKSVLVYRCESEARKLYAPK